MDESHDEDGTKNDYYITITVYQIFCGGIETQIYVILILLQTSCKKESFPQFNPLPTVIIITTLNSIPKSSQNNVLINIPIYLYKQL